jgi:Tfp pilus assembly protein FimT
MELLFVLGLVALIALLAMGGLTLLCQRRMGTVLAVSPSRAATRNRATAGRASSAHK